MNNYRLILIRNAGAMTLCIVTLLFSGLISCQNRTGQSSAARTISFDEGWRFVKDTVPGAEAPSFDDSGWRLLDVPHDWSIEDLPGQDGENIKGPFDKSAIDKMSSGYTVGGTAWYRKSFVTSEALRDKIIYLQFDGVYMNADIWLNGQHMGFHPYGYTPFYFDITPLLKPVNEKNVVAVRVRNEGLNSRWYSGSGINRHVWLTAVSPVHVDVQGGIYVTTPVASEQSAVVRVVTTVVNPGPANSNIVLATQLLDPSGKQAGSARSDSELEPGERKEITQEITIKKPSLWSPDTPDLYIAEAAIQLEGSEIDKHQTAFGIRTVKIDARSGLTINGKQVELIGGCYHHDNGPLGAASIDRAEERKIEILKKTGFNAIRTSHNPPSPALLDACDRLGMLVIDEIFDMWEYPKKEMDYHLYFKDWWREDVGSWVRRDRNHPSVIIWSIGNEIHETFDTTGLRIARNIAGEIRRLDPTRAVTEAFNDFAARRGLKSKWDEIPEHMALLDVVGYNYMYNRYENDHAKYPDRIIVGTETNPPLALENWELVEKHPYVIGYFVWTATDNIGEAGVGMPQLRDIAQEESQVTGNMPGINQGPPAVPGAAMPPGGGQTGLTPGQTGTPPAGAPGGGFFRRDTWPVYTNYQGDIDLIGNRKVPSYYQYVVWGKSKVEMFVHRPIPEGKREVTSRWGFPDELKSWNWKGQEGEKFQVHVYTRCSHVKLELNGKNVGEQDVDQGKSITATFDVAYEPGTLTARCFNEGKEIASQTIETTGEPAAVRLIADRTRIKADRNDLAYIRTEIVDKDGNIVPDADNITVNFDVTGAGTLAATGNGDPRDMSSFMQPLRKSFQGICLAIIRPGTTPGKITLKATAEGLKEAVITIVTKE